MTDTTKSDLRSGPVRRRPLWGLPALARWWILQGLWAIIGGVIIFGDFIVTYQGRAVAVFFTALIALGVASLRIGCSRCGWLIWRRQDLPPVWLISMAILPLCGSGSRRLD